jgi:hypothetical protein
MKTEKMCECLYENFLGTGRNAHTSGHSRKKLGNVQGCSVESNRPFEKYSETF